MQNLAPVIADVFQGIAGVMRQSAAMAEHIAQRDLPRHPGSMHCKLRIMPDDWIVPRDQSIAGKCRNHGRSDGLRHGSKLEDSVGIDRLRLACLPYTEAFEADDLIAMDDGDGQAGYARLFQRFTHQIV